MRYFIFNHLSELAPFKGGYEIRHPKPGLDCVEIYILDKERKRHQIDDFRISL